MKTFDNETAASSRMTCDFAKNKDEEQIVKESQA